MARDRRREYAREKIKRDIRRAERNSDYRQVADLKRVLLSNDLALMNKTHTSVMRALNKQARASSDLKQRAPRKQTVGDALYNARRRLLRQAESIRRQSKSQPDEIFRQMSSFSNMLVEEANRLKGKKLTREKQISEIVRLTELRSRTISASYGMTSTVRRNMIFMQQMNAAGVKGADSGLTKAENSIFWMFTKGLWPKGSNVPRNDRYKEIQKHFYFSESSDAKDFQKWAEERGIDLTERPGDLQTIFDYIMDKSFEGVPGGRDTHLPPTDDMPWDEKYKLLKMLINMAR